MQSIWIWFTSHEAVLAGYALAILSEYLGLNPNSKYDSILQWIKGLLTSKAPKL